MEEGIVCLYRAVSWGKLRLQVAEDWWIWSDAVTTLADGTEGLMSMYGSEEVR